MSAPNGRGTLAMAAVYGLMVSLGWLAAYLYVQAHVL